MSVSYTVTITDEEDKALRHTIVDPEGWIQHAIGNKCRKCVDRVVLNESTYNPKKTEMPVKLDIVKNATLKTRAEIDAEALAELTNKE